ncbi:MAG: AgmX/PglI C-terminal domain-containing protein [Myxococcales bacterium]|nr:AgmX/PglI C-terminal domain-containing protein [Myxococcales bacterium]
MLTAPRVFSALSLWVLLASGCHRPPPTLRAPPPPDPPTEVTLDVERVRRGVPISPSGIDTDRVEGRIRAAVLHEREAISECYERVLPGAPDAAGAVSFDFTVETSGQVINATGDTEVQALRQTRECMLGLIRRMRIEGVSHAAHVRFPFEFENPLLRVSAAEVLLFPRMRTTAPESVATAVGAGSGDLTDQEVNAVMATRAPELLACYTPLLAARATRRNEGAARYEITVAPDGAVVDVTQGEIAEPLATIGSCLQRPLQSLRFRATGRRAVINLPLTLRPQEQPTPPPRGRRG